MKSALMVAGAVLAATVAAASAQDVPNLVGTWKGSANVVLIGSTPYRVAKGKEPNFPDNIMEWTYEIDKQVGNRFSGKASGGDFSETIIGAISPDNRTGKMLDEDGQYDITIVDADTANLCYHHTSTMSRAVGCFPIKRQK